MLWEPTRLFSNPRAVIISHDRYMFDHRIANTHVVNYAKDIFMFHRISQLDECVQHTGAIITKTAAVNLEPPCYPQMKNLLVTLLMFGNVWERRIKGVVIFILHRNSCRNRYAKNRRSGNVEVTHYSVAVLL